MSGRGAPDAGAVHPVTGQQRAAWWDWPIEAVTEHARAIMSGTPAELEHIAAGLAPR